MEMGSQCLLDGAEFEGRVLLVSRAILPLDLDSLSTPTSPTKPLSFRDGDARRCAQNLRHFRDGDARSCALVHWIWDISGVEMPAGWCTPDLRHLIDVPSAVARLEP